jgi:hypothetical protein
MPSSTGPSIDTITEGGLVTQVGEGQEADEVTPPATTFGAPSAGEVLAERYELAEHINNDSAGRQVWRGIDVVLRRPVAVVLRYPGGDSAMEMLQAAVTASRVIHPNLVGVYDAIDEDERAYVVREWVDGQSLRELVAEDGVLDPARATSVAHAISGAVAAVHATGMVHGNIHPGTVMVGREGRVVLADARADGADTTETDVRAIGGILYFALTGHWPHTEARLTGGTEGRGRLALPDAIRDGSGTLAAPRQARAGVPAYLDDLTMDLLDASIEPPSSDVLAAELGRLDVAPEEHYLDSAGPLRFTSGDDEAPGLAPTGRRKLAVGIAGLLVVALVGLLFGINALTGGGSGEAGDNAGATTAPGASVPSGDGAAPVAKPQKIDLAPDQVRVIDPYGDQAELRDIDKAVDGNRNEGWPTQTYKSNFGSWKKGIGILIDLKQPRSVTSVQVELSNPGATAELLTGTNAPPQGSTRDESKAAAKQIASSFTTRIGEPFEEYNGSTMTFSGFQPGQKYQYLLFWISSLPSAGDGSYKVGVQEITVSGI